MKTRRSTRGSLLLRPSQLENSRLASPLMVSSTNRRMQAMREPSSMWWQDKGVYTVGALYSCACVQVQTTAAKWWQLICLHAWCAA
jgi:hypothetical protein